MAISQWPFHLGGSRDRAGDRHAAHADGSTAHRTVSLLQLRFPPVLIEQWDQRPEV